MRTADRRSTSNRNDRGSTADRRRRKEWLIETYRADVDAEVIRFGPVAAVGQWLDDPWTDDQDRAERHPAARCYRCGKLVTAETVVCDRIIPGCEGGTYRRNNIRPSCRECSEWQGGVIGAARR